MSRRPTMRTDVRWCRPLTVTAAIRREERLAVCIWAAPQRMVSGAGLVQDSVHAPRHVPRIARLGGARKPSVCRRLKGDGADKTIKGGRADRGSTGVGGCRQRPAVILRPSMRGPGGPAIEDHAADLSFQNIHDWGNVGIGVLRAGEDGRDK